MIQLDFVSNSCVASTVLVSIMEWNELQLVAQRETCGLSWHVTGSAVPASSLGPTGHPEISASRNVVILLRH